MQKVDRPIRCPLCREMIFGLYEIDHIIPISRGGADVEANKWKVHPECNQLKGTDLPPGVEPKPIYIPSVDKWRIREKMFDRPIPLDPARYTTRMSYVTHAPGEVTWEGSQFRVRRLSDRRGNTGPRWSTAHEVRWDGRVYPDDLVPIATPDMELTDMPWLSEPWAKKADKNQVILEPGRTHWILRLSLPASVNIHHGQRLIDDKRRAPLLAQHIQRCRKRWTELINRYAYIDYNDYEWQCLLRRLGVHDRSGSLFSPIPQ